jgi:hypothetical protein
MESQINDLIKCNQQTQLATHSDYDHIGDPYGNCECKLDYLQEQIVLLLKIINAELKDKPKLLSEEV